MENQMMLKTRAAAQEMNEWLKKTRDAENARLMDAENLLEMLGSCDTVMTPGYCVCRAIQIHYPEVLEGLDCPDLNKSGRETGWSANVCKKVARQLERTPTIGPLHENVWKSEDADGTQKKPPRKKTWAAVLQRGYTESRVSSKNEIYKIAVTFKLTDEEIERLFLLCDQMWSPHNLLDVVFKTMREHYRDNLSWKEIMEVLQRFRSQTNGTRDPAKDAENGGTQLILGKVKEIPDSAEGKAGDSAFKDKLVAELVENANCFDPVELRDVDGEDPLSGSCINRWDRECTYTAAEALRGLLRALVILFPGLVEHYKVEKDGLPKQLETLFRELKDCMGAVSEKATASKEAAMEERLRAYLDGRLLSLQNEVGQTIKVLQHKQPSNRTIDHDAILLLTFFLIWGMRFNANEAEQLKKFESAEQKKPDADLFTKKCGRILRAIAQIDESCDLKEQMKQTMTVFDGVLKIFEEAGLVGVGRIYLVRAMDRLVVAMTLCAKRPEEIDKTADLVEYLLHPEDYCD